MRQFSSPHLAALAVLVVAASASVWLPRRRPGPWMVAYAKVLALVNLGVWLAGEIVVEAIQGIWSAKYNLPLQLTDAVSVVAVLALWSRRALLTELLYFWSLTASLQATATPDLSQNFPSVYYFTYFGYHIGPIVGACFLVFGCRLYPRPGAYRRVFAITLAFTAVVGAANLITGGNYMYLRAKPVHGSLLDVMGPWPVYIFSTVVLALAMLFVLQLLADWLRQRERATGGRVWPPVARRQTRPA